MSEGVTLALNILSAICILTLVALGLAVVFGMMDIVNLAHGEFITIGAFSLAICQKIGGPHAYWLALLIGPLMGMLVGLLLEGGVIRFLYQRTLDSLLATFAVSLILQKLIELVMGSHPQLVYTPIRGSAAILGATYPAYRLFTIAVALCVIAGTLLLLAKSRFGADLRAVIQNPQMAEAVGIDTRRMNRSAFVLGAGLAALAGVLVAPYAPVDTHMGVQYLGKAFFVIIVGGIGSVVGSVVGSSFIGTLETVLNYHVDPSMASAIVLATAMVIVRLRPQGLVPGFSAAHRLLGKG